MSSEKWSTDTKSNSKDRFRFKDKQPYWYKITIYYCPLCGRETEYRERQYTEKPKDYIYELIESYDYCEETYG